MNKLQILNGGLFSTVQDAGRFNQQINGFPISGPMDRMSSQLANSLVGNDANAAVIEMAYIGITAVFPTNSFIAITGAQFKATLNHHRMSTNQAYRVHKGDVLTIAEARSGRYGYLAVKGGIQVAPVLGSRSTSTKLQLGGFHGQQLAAGDSLPILESNVLEGFYHRHVTVPASDDEPIRIVKGPQFSQFSKPAVDRLLEHSYTITPQSDRMGYRMKGPKLDTDLPSLLSEGTVLGGIQVSNDGSPIVLLADRQTTGGYPVIASIIFADVQRFVQLPVGSQVRFKLISTSVAQSINQHQREWLERVQADFANSRLQAPFGINRPTAERLAKLF